MPNNRNRVSLHRSMHRVRAKLSEEPWACLLPPYNPVRAGDEGTGSGGGPCVAQPGKWKEPPYPSVNLKRLHIGLDFSSRSGGLGRSWSRSNGRSETGSTRSGEGPGEELQDITKWQTYQKGSKKGSLRSASSGCERSGEARAYSRGAQGTGRS